MSSTLKLRATVLTGNRVEFTAPELPEGAEVEISVTLPESSQPPPTCGLHGGGVADYLTSLPAVPRTAEEWAAIEQEFRQERDAWDR